MPRKAYQDIHTTSPNNWVIIGPDCPVCGSSCPEFRCTKEQAYAYLNRTVVIQNIMPNVVPDDRERFISGICSPCWNKEFGVL